MSKHRFPLAKRARHEIATKTDAQIEWDTATKWASRAAACMEKFFETRDSRWIVRAESYRHEAVEHAAMVSDGGVLVGRLQKLLAPIERAVSFNLVKHRRIS